MAGDPAESGGQEAEQPDGSAAGRSDAEASAGPPPFLRQGILTVGVFVVAVTVLLVFSRGDLQGPPLVAFAAGFLVFMTFYFVSMWIGWLFFQ